MRALRLAAALACVLVLLAPIRAAALLIGRRAPGPITQFGHRILLAALGIRVVQEGSDLRPDALILANHLSYTDVLAVGSLLPAQFVAKAEVAHWPILGWLARFNPTVFVDRGERGRVGTQTDALARALRAGPVVLFPEGTSSDGRDVLPFRSALLAAAEATGAPVQAVAITYRPRQGGADPAWLSRFAWHGDEAFAPHLIRLLRSGGAICHVHVGSPVPCAPGSRKQVAAAARDDIRARLGL